MKMRPEEKLSERILTVIEQIGSSRDSTRRELLEVVLLLDEQVGEEELQALITIASKLGGKGIDVGKTIPFLKVSVPYGALHSLADRDECMYIDLNQTDISIIPPMPVSSVEAVVPSMADVTHRVREGIFEYTTGKDFIIGILDTGFTQHNFIPSDRVTAENFTGENNHYDPHGHGTFIVGQWLSGSRQCPGLVPEARVLSGRIFDSNQQATLDSILKGFNFMMTQRPHVLNLSWGSDYESQIITRAIRSLIQANIVVVASAGNNGNTDGSYSTIVYPGAQNEVICVGAIYKDDSLCEWSSTGARGQGKPDVVSYGAEIVSVRAEGTTMGTPIDHYMVCASGTSFSGPIVAAEIVMMLEHYKSRKLSPPKAEDMRTFIREHCCRSIKRK